jgi:hypothetical protein
VKRDKNFGGEPYISKKCLSTIRRCRPDEQELGSVCLLDSIMRYIVERTNSNAESTLDMSSADVSKYIMPFSAVYLFIYYKTNAMVRVTSPGRKAKSQSQRTQISAGRECQGSERTGKRCGL